MDDTLLSEPAELALAEAVAAAIDDTGAALAQRDYVSVLSGLAKLRPQVDAFFDQVLVNAEDPAVRGNRLACSRPGRALRPRGGDRALVGLSPRKHR
jgi:glycyl-tRNA synthetase beta chain